jgi:hypothetical protein
VTDLFGLNSYQAAVLEYDAEQLRIWQRIARLADEAAQAVSDGDVVLALAGLGLLRDSVQTQHEYWAACVRDDGDQ